MNTNSNISQELLENVERYYNNLMPQQERTDFENKLQEDDAFRTQVEDIKTLLLGIEAQSLKEQLNEFHADINQKETITKQPVKVKRLSFQRIAIAAGLVIAFGCFWYFAETPNEKLYSEFFTPDPGLPTTMSSTKSYEFFDAMVNYKQGDYKSAIKKWKSLEVANTENDTLTYFIGVAHLAKGNTDDAITYLQKSTDFKNSVFKNDAYYYLGMAYLKNNQKEDALKFLKLSTLENSQKLYDKLK